jgi:dTDP-4-dehydrorhamnose 3,5-epimerase
VGAEVEFQSLDIPGAFEIQPRVAGDQRGRFVKPFHAEMFEAAGLRIDFREQYFSDSVRGVVRGLHFQTPPMDHAKLVYCVHGAVFDVLLDLRTGSPTFGQHRSLTLSAEAGNAVYLPAGLAHGFASISNLATLVYNVTSVYSPDHDSGIAWDSAEIAWPIENPTVSDRDLSLPTLKQFESPFEFSDAS